MIKRIIELVISSIIIGSLIMMWLVIFTESEGRDFKIIIYLLITLCGIFLLGLHYNYARYISLLVRFEHLDEFSDMLIERIQCMSEKELNRKARQRNGILDLVKSISDDLDDLDKHTNTKEKSDEK